MPIQIVRTVSALRKAAAAQRRQSRRIGVVPTMGALHKGHLALVGRALEVADVVIATLFVNPTQFAANEDLSKYPRTETSDVARFEQAGVEIVFIPSVEEMYPTGFATTVRVAGPATAGLEDRFRPGHFEGVATVVAKLFIQSSADVAVFGEKDWQQLAVVRRMAADLDLPIEVIAHETVREADGLAMSSRNRYLSPEDRVKAPTLHRVLTDAAQAIRGGGDFGQTLAAARAGLSAAGFAIDYLEARDAASLEPVEELTDRPIRLLAAARLGATRLLDNLAV